ncbi:hypothetical protein HCH_02830 [Hahella chejuensis KCTC 2396]|uniref:Uncharacterized protein n=1 Tax=Hahella chejuensis (strain KCTC 2396) TaxID=349521 RepID=Q2SIB6_HAHCH|nr:hypothetical protein [Hahella chejuensis]ABC29608.1 hypothetical protein HCH_02830 [Hahella chejuensis KCTC 2396]
MFTDQQIHLLHNQQPITDEPPWSGGDERAIDGFYKFIFARVSQLTMAKVHAEWEHYGSGYASFIDACFHKDKAHLHGQIEPEQRRLQVLFSRLSPYFVMLETEAPLSGFKLLPSFSGLDQLSGPDILNLAQAVQPVLEDFGLVRLYQSDLETTLSRKVKVPTVLNEGACREFDALFYWED